MSTGEDFRIGQAERDQAIAELRRAAEEGRLTAPELDERTERVRVARTTGDLGRVLTDLRPGALVPGPVVVPTAAEALAALANVGQRP
ncbi:MAG TPA: DUF1707 domain-containing protein, partial [Propionicimonas sp.]|nr:DUF1707 domain-containing protein [Propionicimonas sp.]